MVVVRYKRLLYANGIEPPSYATDWAAGFDLRAALLPEEYGEFSLAPGTRALIPTGLILAIPKGFEGQIRPRSGLALKHGVTVLNAPGTIDADYRGEIKVLLINHGDKAFPIDNGDRIAQLVIAPVQTVTLQESYNLDETERGEGGFGSTGTD